MTALDPTLDADAVDAEAARKDTVGWSRLGYEMREPTWDNADLVHVAGRTVVVTGATAGLGLATAERLVTLGAHVVLVSRDAAKLERVAAEIESHTGRPVKAWVQCDLGSLASVRAAAAELLERLDEIHVLVNNAGILIHEHLMTEDGFEKVWATNLLGPYLLTELLMDRLVASAPARVIEVTSGGMYSQRIDVVDHQTLEQEYDGRAVYSRTKRGQVILTELRAEQHRDSGVVFHSMHPGWAATPGVYDSIPDFAAKFEDVLRTPAQGADTIVWLAAADEPARSSGLLWQDRRARETHRDESTKETAEERARLIELLREQSQPIS
ncbi:SDR family NAD(P)-dependent oxidoreductase [Nocardioides flavescens]|uniref:SDR family NAD(P)-dependent oxidoreductase n=1 Tax=Nocardioides flavescens TaxID=2691959 RepID=A0A6L7F4F8_9ACTN|nr:SDR family NAD(P)-dependent oxidoreductase [Nocardioides flavescens]MXG92051.1 SDR family NAD(P)-dependent oxidoreductase [Nocardioides flavescens]